MKKLALLFALLLLFAACGRPAPVRFEPERYFTAAFSLENGDYIIEGEIRCCAYDDIRLSFTHPALLRFFTVRAAPEGFFTDVAGVPDTVEARRMPTFAPINVLCEALRRAVFEHNEWTRAADGGCETKIPIGGRTVTARFDADGYMTGIDCPETDLKVRLTIKDER